MALVPVPLPLVLVRCSSRYLASPSALWMCAMQAAHVMSAVARAGYVVVVVAAAPAMVCALCPPDHQVQAGRAAVHGRVPMDGRGCAVAAVPVLAATSAWAHADASMAAYLDVVDAEPAATASVDAGAGACADELDVMRVPWWTAWALPGMTLEVATRRQQIFVRVGLLGLVACHAASSAVPDLALYCLQTDAAMLVAAVRLVRLDRYLKPAEAVHGRAGK